VPALAGGPAPPERAQTTPVRPRPRRAAVFGGVIGVAVLSFLIALASRGKSSGIAPHDLALAMTPRDATPDAAADSAADAMPDATADATADAMPDATADVAPDGTADGTPDAPPDRTPDRTPDEAPDATRDAAPAGSLAPGSMAILDVRTRPDGAIIKVAGQTHTSPAVLKLPAGHYEIVAELDGWVRERRAVDLAAGDRVGQEIGFTTPSARRGRTAQPGRLTVRTTPACDVYLGNRWLGRTPFANLELEPGSYALELRFTNKKVTRSVAITAGKPTVLSFALP
jgi:hypothetical protein